MHVDDCWKQSEKMRTAVMYTAHELQVSCTPAINRRCTRMVVEGGKFFFFLMEVESQTGSLLKWGGPHPQLQNPYCSGPKKDPIILGNPKALIRFDRRDSP